MIRPRSRWWLTFFAVSLCAAPVVGGVFIELRFHLALRNLRHGMSKQEVERVLGSAGHPAAAQRVRRSLADRGLIFDAHPIVGRCPVDHGSVARVAADKLVLEGCKARIWFGYLGAALVYFDEGDRVACVMKGAT